MNRRTWLITAGGTAFVLFLLAGIPAASALRWLAPATVQATGAGGTLWSGSAIGLDVAGLRLGETRWNLSPMALMLGRAAGDVTTRLGDATAGGHVSLSLSGDLSCEHCSYEGSLVGLRPFVPALKLLQGQARIDLDALEIADRWPTRIIGTAKLSGLPLMIPGNAAQPTGAVANFDATVNADPVAADGTIEASVQDAGGPLQVTARVTLRRPGNYELTGRAKARPDAPTEIATALNLLGPKGADGTTEISLAGTL